MMRIQTSTKSIFKVSAIGLTILLIGGCRSGHSRLQDENETIDFDTSTPLPSGITQFSEAIRKMNPQAFATHVSYPLPRPYPLRDIEDSTMMVNYFPIMIDDSLRNVFAKASRADWAQAGWRGWTLDAGQYIWYEDGIYAFPYISKKEKQLLRKAIEKDLASLSPELSRGWEPLMCVESASPNYIYRIDRSITTPDQYRLLEYALSDNLRSTPRLIMEGEMTLDGTMQTRIFNFKGKNGETALFFPDPSDDSSMSIDFKTKESDSPHTIFVNPVYWIDFIKN